MPGVDSLSKIGLGSGSGFNMGNLMQTIWDVSKWVIPLMLILFAFYWFVIRAKRYKDLIEVWDVTGGGIVTYPDQGYWKEDKATGTGHYALLKSGKVQVKHPGTENATITRKGKYRFRFLKFGESAFDYAVLPPIVAKCKEDIPAPIPLADQDWAKLKIRQAAEKRTLSGWWNENKGFVITTTAMVIALVIMLSLIPAAKEAAISITAANQQYVDALTALTNRLETIGNQMGGSIPNPADPPPGI